MMANKLTIILVIFTLLIESSFHNKLDDDLNADDNINPFQDITDGILSEQNADNIGAVISNLVQSGGAQQLGNMLLGAVQHDKSGKLLDGLGSLLKSTGANLDPSMLGDLANMLSTNVKKPGSGSGGFDLSSLLQMLSGMMTQGGGSAEGLMDLLPSILQTYSSFVGPDAERREHDHAGHAWLLPPIVERFHLLLDHFVNSQMGRSLINTIGAEKFVKIFADDSGKFNYGKFVEMLENHSFRKHWIQMLTNRIALIVSYVADPKIHQKYFNNFQYLINSYARSEGFPKNALFDPSQPSETLAVFLNYFIKKTANVAVDTKQYVKPAVAYVKELFRLAQTKGILSGVDSRQLSNKLADTINLEIIEPIVRVNRAFRFASKVPKCDKYVMCLVNQDQVDEQTSLPGLKGLLSKSSSMMASWFLSSHTESSFWSLYNVITEPKDCPALFLDACNDFHVEEVKVTTEYDHNEL